MINYTLVSADNEHFENYVKLCNNIDEIDYNAIDKNRNK